MYWGSNVQVEIGHLNICVGAALCVVWLKVPWVLSWWLHWCSWTQEEEDLFGTAILSLWNFPLLISPEMPLTWGINLEKPRFADHGTFYMLISQLSSEWFTKSDVMISDTILWSCLTNSKAPLWSWSTAVLAAGTSKFKLDCSERVEICLSPSQRMSLA